MSNIPLVGDVMTHQVITIGREQSMAMALKLMQDNSIRHLPVLHGGDLVGMLSQRELYALDGLPDIDSKTLPVEEALLGDTFSVSPQTPLNQVLDRMVAERLGSVVVQDGHDVVGIFTTVDAMKLLSKKLLS